jgi:hypothetical protein
MSQEDKNRLKTAKIISSIMCFLAGFITALLLVLIIALWAQQQHYYLENNKSFNSKFTDDCDYLNAPKMIFSSNYSAVSFLFF